MKNGRIYAILFGLCLPVAVSARNIRLVNSTDQSWSGGVAGRAGNNYTFTIEFSGFKSDPLPDTLWIGQQPTPISMAEQ